MIKLKELVNRVYDGKDCIRFEYEVVQRDGEKESSCFIARYWREKDVPVQWSMQVVIPGNRDCDCQVYTFDYVLPREKMDLALIAAIGLRYFQLRLKEDIQKKTAWDFSLGEVLHDMYGGD